MSEPIDLRCFCSICGGRIAFPPEVSGTMAACPHCNSQTLLEMSVEAMKEDGVPLPGEGTPLPAKRAFPKPKQYVAPAPDDLVACRECGTVNMQTQMTRLGDDEWICFECQPPSKPALASELRVEAEPAGFGIRFVAKVADLIILAGIVWLTSVMFSSPTGKVAMWVAKLPFVPGWSFVARALGATLTALPLIYLYQTCFLVLRGATPGKMFCELKVIDSNGDRPTWGLGTARFMVELLFNFTLNILFFQADYIIAAFDSQKRTYHDLVCKTWVVSEKPAKKTR